ncbi:MAG: COX15/CtaA family protein [Turneriella sp.]
MPSVDSQNKPVARWLFACAAMVFCIVVVGGITRLTRSGLSIVEWKPFAGTLPPMGEAAWNEEFAKYRETPEYKLVNRGMQLAEFKNIFWWEYIHRVLARLIGVVFLLPFLWFLIRKKIRGFMAGRLALIFLLGGAQGFLGWYMVKSGLVKDPHVSHLRLMSHLLLAVLLYVTMLYTAWQFLHPQAEKRKSKVGWMNVLVTFILIGSGALVAGLKAGKMYNTFPLMNGSYFPPGVELQGSFLSNLIDNPAIVQFIHRNIAYLLGILIAVQIYIRRGEIRDANFKHPLMLFFAIYLLQVLLGVLTLLHAVPVSLGALHQANAMLLFSAALYVMRNSPRINSGAIQ